jgi:ribosomal protein L3
MRVIGILGKKMGMTQVPLSLKGFVPVTAV